MTIKLEFTRWASALLALALAAGPLSAQQTTKLDTTNFIVMGEGLGAGMADFALRDVYQNYTFGAQMAAIFQTAFPQPIIQSPGIGSAPGFPVIPVRLPGTAQGSVRNDFPPQLFIFNLSVPGLTLADSLGQRPISPLIQQNNVQQTVINMTLGYPALIAGAGLPLWTQTEYAVAMNPTFVIVELGYYDVLEPAVNNNPAGLPDPATFQANLTTLLKKVGASYPQIIVMTVPNPFDTAFFTPVTSATQYVGASVAELERIYKVQSTDLLTPNGLALVGGLILENDVGQLLNPLFPGLGAYFPGTVVSAATQTAVQANVAALNTAITSAASAAGAHVYDLQGLFSRIHSQGLQVGSSNLTAQFLGGFYSLDGYYPGVTGQGLIANELLTMVNKTYNTSYPLVDLTTLMLKDPVAGYTPNNNPNGLARKGRTR
jgi:hypothetical protein